MTLNVAILVSAGAHPLSGRPRRADLDARAIELALRLVARHTAIVLHPIHVGNPNEVSLRDYIGMGLDRLTVLDVRDCSDPLQPLAEHLSNLKPAITLAGLRSETGEGSGFLPYALAEALGLRIAPSIIDLGVDGSEVRLVQALRGGMRRSLSCRIPIMATVDKAAPEPRQSSYGKARRGRIETLSVHALPDPCRNEWRVAPSVKRGRRLVTTGPRSAADRLSAVTDVKRGTGQVMSHPTPDEAAQAIFNFLLEKGILKVTPPSIPAGERGHGKSTFA
jgi:electron transfer flavoprotein beta subunit